MVNIELQNFCKNFHFPLVMHNNFMHHIANMISVPARYSCHLPSVEIDVCVCDDVLPWEYLVLMVLSENLARSLYLAKRFRR